MKLQFKFKNNVEEKSRSIIIKILEKHGAMRVRRLFPKETDRQLESIYTLEYGDEDIGKNLLELLKKSKKVEFAEEEVIRKLIT